MIETEIQPRPVTSEENGEPFTPEREISLLDYLIILLERKRFIAGFVACGLVFSVLLALLLPIEYEGKVVLLPPQQNSSVGSSLTGQVGEALGSLASLASGLSLKNPTDMYVSLLKSRTVEDAMIDRFGLMQEYHRKKISDARKALERHVSITAGTKDGLIRITFDDHDPKRSAELANGYVEEFRRLSESLAITEAARRRLFFQRELNQSKIDLTQAEEAMAKTQQKTGVLEIGSQARTLIEQAAVLRAQVTAKEVQIEGMRSFATEDNPELVLAKQELTALQAQLQRVSESEQDQGSGLNLSKGRVTQEGMEYLRRYRDLKYEETVFELLAKELEIAKLDEAREGAIIQVVDAAVIPDKKSFPPRVLIVIGVTIFSVFMAAFWVILRRRFDVASELPENRHRIRVIRQLWRSKPEEV